MDFEQVFHNLIRLYPKDYQFRFAREILVAIEASADERRRIGGAAFWRFVLVEVTGLLRGAASEWIAKFSTDPSTRSLYLPDLRMMHLPWLPRIAQ